MSDWPRFWRTQIEERKILKEQSWKESRFRDRPLEEAQDLCKGRPGALGAWDSREGVSGGSVQTDI